MTENRRYQRNELMQILGVYLIIPVRGEERMKVKDINGEGLAFYAMAGLKYDPGDTIQAYFHITDKIKLSLTLKVVYTEDDSEGTRVGCEAQDLSTPAMTAFGDFSRFIRSLSQIY